MGVGVVVDKCSYVGVSGGSPLGCLFLVLVGWGGYGEQAGSSLV